MSPADRSPIPSIPDGYWRKANGDLVPIDRIKTIDRLRTELVTQMVDDALDLQSRMIAFKKRAMDEVSAFVSLSAAEYGVKLGGAKGNVSLVTFDGQLKIQLAMQESLVFDERLQAAKQLIDGCIRRWTDGTRSEVRALIDGAFQVDRAGNISTSRVLGLRRLDITDPEWLRAMDAISDSVMVANSTAYIRFYVRDDEQWEAISLDLAAL